MIIDTEALLSYRFFPLYGHDVKRTYWSPKKDRSWEFTLANPMTNREFTGDLFLAEMDRAGVDKAIVQTVYPEDFRQFFEYFGASLENYVGGREHTLSYLNEKTRERLLWFNVINLQRKGSLEGIEQDIKDGVRGFKTFPRWHFFRIDDPKMMELYQICSEKKLPVGLGLENSWKGTYDHKSMTEQIAKVTKKFDDVNFLIDHAGLTVEGEGCTSPDDPEVQPFFEMAKKRDNIYLGCYFLMPPGHEVEDYPFPTSLKWLKTIVKKVGIEKLTWASDYPFSENHAKYVQMLDWIRKHADFLSEDERAMILGKNTKRYLKLK
jgi:predicted TIM-barrel fold metal-dependent hydrolase